MGRMTSWPRNGGSGEATTTHAFTLSAAVAGEGFVKRFRLFAAFSHLSRAAKKQEGEAGAAGAETQGKAEYARGRGAVKKAERRRQGFAAARHGGSCRDGRCLRLMQNADST